MGRLVIDRVTSKTYSGVSVTDPKLEGIRVIRSYGIVLDRPTVTDCALAGIYDFGYQGLRILEPTILRCGRAVTADSLGKDTAGSGIQVQGLGTRIQGGRVEDCGSDDTFEHGLYLSSAARGYVVTGGKYLRNAASGIKASGTGTIMGALIMGSVRGLVLADTISGVVKIRGLRISTAPSPKHPTWTRSAILVTSTVTEIDRFDCDENTYAPGERFSWKGRSYDLPGWQRASGLDRHSVYGEVRDS